MTCPKPEELFGELESGRGPALDHARECDSCGALLEAHRQLEKDLFRLVDPLPPPDFVESVMRRIDAEPAPRGFEMAKGLGILFASCAAGLIALFARPSALGQLGLGAFAWAESGMAIFSAFAGAARALWNQAALPISLGLMVLLATALYGLGKVAGPAWTEAKA